MAPQTRKDSKVKVKEVKLLPLTKEIRTKLNVWGLGGLFSVGWSDSHEALVQEMGSDTTKTSNPDTPNKRKAQRQVISDSEAETEEQKEVKKEKASSSQLGEKIGPSDQPVDINELGIQLFDLRKVTSKIFRVLHLDPILGSAADLVEALKSAVSAATPALTVDLKPWKEMIAKLVKLLSLERQKRKGLAEQHVYLKEKITRAGKVPEMAIWCAHQLQAARETETRLSALVETLKKKLTSHGLSVPSEASADEIAKLEGRLQECTDSLASLLGQNPPTGGSEPDSDDSHVTHIVDLAKMMIAEE
ncbi:hypothetical protein R1sor_005389 [Riccia sorocarpa]|uniref:Uncharacterized protein n=1 Tax=Riccia sorocarpa TaxID=122646 RepID=A0ABD3HK07_9MARC